MNVCVVIPIYKEKPTDWEIASFRQVLKVLSRYDIFLYTYQGLDLSIYTNESTNLNKDFNVEYFDQDFFSSVKGYNRLCLTVDFYKRVSKYEYMLIYQLDAWVFRDELEYWCNKGYDYIGAPFMPPWGEQKWLVGNGGFSLRRIDSHIRLLSYKYPLSFCLDFKHGARGLVKSIIKSFGFCNTISYYANRKDKKFNEDWLLSNIFSDISKKNVFQLHKPTVDEAITFSIECSPSYFYGISGNKLPFGCHAFEKYEFETFWKKHIII